MGGVLTTVETETKYSGYIQQQERQMERMKNAERRPIPAEFAFQGIPGLSREVQQKLERVRPGSLGQAARIPGVTPGGGRDSRLLPESCPCLRNFPPSRPTTTCCSAGTSTLNLTRIDSIERNYGESLFLGGILPPGPLRICDIGSGAGFPGFPVAILRPDCQVTLIEVAPTQGGLSEGGFAGYSEYPGFGQAGAGSAGELRLGDLAGGQRGRSGAVPDATGFERRAADRSGSAGHSWRIRWEEAVPLGGRDGAVSAESVHCFT